MWIPMQVTLDELHNLRNVLQAHLEPDPTKYTPESAQLTNTLLEQVEALHNVKCDSPDCHHEPIPFRLTDKALNFGEHSD